MYGYFTLIYTYIHMMVELEAGSRAGASLGSETLSGCLFILIGLRGCCATILSAVPKSQILREAPSVLVISAFLKGRNEQQPSSGSELCCTEGFTKCGMDQPPTTFGSISGKNVIAGTNVTGSLNLTINNNSGKFLPNSSFSQLFLSYESHTC